MSECPGKVTISVEWRRRNVMASEIPGDISVCTQAYGLISKNHKTVIRNLHDCPSQMSEKLMISNSKLMTDKVNRIILRTQMFFFLYSWILIKRTVWHHFIILAVSKYYRVYDCNHCNHKCTDSHYIIKPLSTRIWLMFTTRIRCKSTANVFYRSHKKTVDPICISYLISYTFDKMCNTYECPCDIQITLKLIDTTDRTKHI